ncbi:MAG: cytidylate kinase family protein [Clostridia bacterium]
MKKKHIITLAGDLASGKGTVSELLKRDLSYDIYRNGEYFRKLAKDKNMTVKEFNIYVKKYPEIDIQIEKSAEKYAKEHDNLIIDARLGWYVVPEAFNVYMSVDLEVSAKRALNDAKRAATETYESLEHAKSDIKERSELENKRYYKIYGIRKNDMSNYHFVIDTTTLTPEEVNFEIIKAYKKWLQE